MNQQLSLISWRTCLLLSCLVAVTTSPTTGGTWTGHNDGLQNLTINGIGIAPSTPNTIYIQTRSLGVYKSTDAGQTWTKTATFNDDKGPGYDHLVHDGPAVHPANPDIVWAASSGKVYKTTNGGGTWTLSSTGTTIGTNCNGIHGIIIDPTDSNHLYAGTIIAGCDGGVFESTDGGANWMNIAGSLVTGSTVNNDAWPMAIDPSNPNRLYCGSPHNSIYRSTDGGHTWTNSPPVGGDQSTYAVAINPLATNEIWCDEIGGTWRSTDYGQTWTRQTGLFNDRSIIAMRFAPSNFQVAYAIVGNAIWRSDNNGATWSARAEVDGGPRCLEIDPANPDVVYLGTTGLGMYKSTDGGQTFSEINSGLPMTQLIRGWQAFADHAVENVLYCVLDGNVMYTLPAGETNWQYYSVLPGNYLPQVQVDRHQPNRWYNPAGGLWRSLDSGLTWEEIYTNGVDTNVFDVWLDPRRCGRILIGDKDGNRILLSEDAGESWIVLGSVPIANGSLSGLCGDPFDPNLVLVAAAPPWHAEGQHGYVWRSTNSGFTWEHVRDRMFYGDWRIGSGYWKLESYAMAQKQSCCSGYHVNLDHHTFGNGTYECKMRIYSSDAGDTKYWAGFSIRLDTPDSKFTDSGWLVFMRRNGVVALHNSIDGIVINAEELPVVSNTYNWNTIKLVTIGNSFQLYANDILVGTYTDPNHRYDNPGYFALQTNRTESSFDNLSIQAETNYSDTFDYLDRHAAYWGRWIVSDPHNPGQFAYATQWGGLWYSSDYGATWRLLSDDGRLSPLHYRPFFSTTRSGNLFTSSGSGTSWRIDNYYNDGHSWQQVGQNLATSTWLLSEDPHNTDRMYACFYDLGVSIYDGSDIIGVPAPPIPVRIDFDQDGDVDQADFGYLQACFSGPGTPQTDPLCLNALLDQDDDVDSADLNRFLDCMRGPSVPPDPSCDCRLGE